MDPVGQALQALKKLGYVPYVLVLLSLLTAHYKRSLGESASIVQTQFLDMGSGFLFAGAIIAALVKLFQRWFETRPARGLIDGLAAGVFAGLVGGYFGYAWHDFPLQMEDPDLVNDRLRWVRSVLALVFAVPIAGMVGLGCDLVHADRKLEWRKCLGPLLVTSLLFLGAVGALIFFYLPRVDGRGICLSDLLFLFEFFLLGYATIMAVTFHWTLPKFLSRLLWIIAVVLVTRVITYFIQTADWTSVYWAIELELIPPDAEVVSLWERLFSFDYEPSADGEDQFLMAKIVVALCLWSIGAYAAFYLDHPWALKLDKGVEKLYRRVRPSKKRNRKAAKASPAPAGLAAKKKPAKRRPSKRTTPKRRQKKNGDVEAD